MFLAPRFDFFYSNINSKGVLLEKKKAEWAPFITYLTRIWIGLSLTKMLANTWENLYVDMSAGMSADASADVLGTISYY